MEENFSLLFPMSTERQWTGNNVKSIRSRFFAFRIRDLGLDKLDTNPAM